jgi:F-type H+-transporting ATPase subunit delta
MSRRTSATRYARALLDVAIQESDPAKIEQDLSSFVTMVDSNAELKSALLSPRVPANRRRSVVTTLLEKSGAELPLVKLLGMLADRGRLDLLHDLLDVYRERRLAHENIVKGTVTSAAPIAPEDVAALERSLSGATGKQVQLDVALDPQLIGGVVTRIGSTVYDGSIRTQLARMKQQLVENAS